MGRGFSAVDGDDEDSAADQVGHGTTVQGVIAASGDDGGILGVNWGEVGAASAGCGRAWAGAAGPSS